MKYWNKLSDSEKECFKLEGNGFKQTEIGIIRDVDYSTVRGELHSGKRKAKARSITHAVAVFTREGEITEILPQDLTLLERKVAQYKKKYGTPKKKAKTVAKKASPPPDNIA